MNEVPGAVREGGELKVIVTNAGPGVAKNIRGSVEVTKGTKTSGGEKRVPRQVNIPQLSAGGSHTIDAPRASARPRDLSALLTYEDFDNRKHWARLLCPSGNWEHGEGDPPSPEASHADS